MDNTEEIRSQKLNLKQKNFLVDKVANCFEQGLSVDWEQLTVDVNHLGPPVKDTVAWKKCFEHAKSKAKRKPSEKSDLDRRLASIGSIKSRGAIKRVKGKPGRSRNKLTAHELLEQSLYNQKLILKEITTQRNEEHGALLKLNKTCDRK